MKHVFIINPVSGKTDAGKRMVPLIEAAAKAAGLEIEVVYTEAARHAVQLAAQYAQAGGPVRLYAVGGDGTLNEVMTGAYTYPNAEVACVPVGSGNDFVRNFGTVEQFLDIAGQMNGEAFPIDLMDVNGDISMAITCTGLDAEVAHNIPKYRRIPFLGGTMAYNISIVEKLLQPLGRDLKITVGGKTVQKKYLIVAVCNGGYYGGGYNAAPACSLIDGMLDVVLVQKISRLRIAAVIGKYKKGAHIQNGTVIPRFADIMEYYRGNEVEIVPVGDKEILTIIDGESSSVPGLRIKALPLAGRFVLPEKLAKTYKWQ